MAAIGFIYAWQKLYPLTSLVIGQLVIGHWPLTSKIIGLISKEKLQRLFALFVPCLLTGAVYLNLPPNNPCMLCALEWNMANYIWSSLVKSHTRAVNHI